MSKIKLFAMQVPCDEELEENEVFVEFTVKELLDQIESSDVYDYAIDNLNLVNEDDVKTNLDDFNEDKLIEELENKRYNFLKQIGEEECIEFLEDSGYTVTYRSKDLGYDYVDNCLFEEISDKFNSLSVFGRQELRDLIINF